MSHFRSLGSNKSPGLNGLPTRKSSKHLEEKKKKEEEDNLQNFLLDINCAKYYANIRKAEITLQQLQSGDITEEHLHHIKIPMGPAVSIVKKARGVKNANDIPHSNEDLFLDDITLGNSLGGGAFGEVFEGLWQGVVKVAVKKLHNPEAFEEFKKEAHILKLLRHPNIVSLYGLHITEKESLIVTELMNLGNLRSFLQKNGPELIHAADLFSMGKNTCAGMLYLSANKIIHRDLAARNLLVKKEDDHLLIKVADFGLSRKVDDHYNVSATSKMPVRWTAPEAFTDSVVTSNSDVFSFGVVLFEIWTYGADPWLGYSNQEVKEMVVKGKQMDIPPGCPPFMYKLMKMCWSTKPQERPSFKELYDELTKFETEYLPSIQEQEQKLPHKSDDGSYIDLSSGNYADAQGGYVYTD